MTRKNGMYGQHNSVSVHFQSVYTVLKIGVANVFGKSTFSNLVIINLCGDCAILYSTFILTANRIQ